MTRAGIPSLQLCVHGYQVLSSLGKLRVRKEKNQEATTTDERADLPQASSEAGEKLLRSTGVASPLSCQHKPRAGAAQCYRSQGEGRHSCSSTSGKKKKKKKKAEKVVIIFHSPWQTL